MHLRVGQRLDGVKWSYGIGQALGKSSQGSFAFKALMLPGPQSSVPAQWALIKTAPGYKPLPLKSEHDLHSRPAIASCSSIRSMYDMIGHPIDLDNSAVQSPPCLVFEWMDTSLAQLSSEKRRHNSVFVKALCKGVLTALASLKQENLVHTVIGPETILLSDPDGQCPVVKIGDLLHAIPSTHSSFCPPQTFDTPGPNLLRSLLLAKSFSHGSYRSLQPIETRAPEVWRGIGCFHSSDVWAFAVTLFNWLKPGVFGTQEGFVKGGDCAPTFSLAKLMRLFPDEIAPPTINGDSLWGRYRMAKVLAQAPDPDKLGKWYIKSVPLEEELARMDIPPNLANFLRYLLVVDHEKRPSAAEALCSKEFEALG